MKALNIGVKDFEMGIKTRRFQITVALFVVLSLGMVYGLKKLDINTNLYKTPFQMLFLSNFSNAFNYLIALLGILLGASAISDEIEKGTLNLVVSKPVYRDEIIVGKLLGGLLTISVALGLFYMLTVAFALILGVPITKNDLIKFLATLPFSVLYGLVFFGFGLLISALIKKSKNALIMAIFLFVFFSFLLSIIAGIVAFSVAGLPPIPEVPENAANLTEDQLQEILLKDPAYQEWLAKTITTTQKVLYISPNYHYQEIIRLIFGGKPQIREIVSAIVYDQNIVEDRPLKESLPLIWQDIVILIVMFLLSCIITHTKFVGTDLR